MIYSTGPIKLCALAFSPRDHSLLPKAKRRAHRQGVPEPSAQSLIEKTVHKTEIKTMNLFDALKKPHAAQLIEALLKLGACPNAVNAAGQTALDVAQSNNDERSSHLIRRAAATKTASAHSPEVPEKRQRTIAQTVKSPVNSNADSRTGVSCAVPINHPPNRGIKIVKRQTTALRSA